MLLAWLALWLPSEVRGRPLQLEWDLHRFMERHCFGSRMYRAPPRKATLWCVLWQHLWQRLLGHVPDGCAAITLRKDHYWLHNMCVHRSRRSQGIGLLLHRRLLALCRQHGRHRTTRLDIMSTNAAALALIGKLPEYNEIASPHTDRRVFECRW